MRAWGGCISPRSSAWQRRTLLPKVVRSIMVGITSRRDRRARPVAPPPLRRSHAHPVEPDVGRKPPHVQQSVAFGPVYPLGPRLHRGAVGELSFDSAFNRVDVAADAGGHRSTVSAAGAAAVPLCQT